jgi:hypothetical protein
MSGFLERLAAGVLHEQRAVHPSVGTIWSAAGTMGRELEAPGTGQPLEISSEVVAAPPRHADAPQPPATQPLQLHGIRHHPRMQPERSPRIAESEGKRHAEQPVIDEAVAFRPLVVSPQRKDASALPPASRTDAAAQASESILTHRLHAPSPDDAGSRHPNRIESTLVPPRIPLPGPTASHTASPFLPPSPRPAQPSPSHAEERDAIEIHIGRIEVLAAPPRPAQPAAPAPARKSLDLGEYLRRERRPR